MIDIIKGSLEQYIMSNSLIDKIKILEEDKEIGNFLALMWSIQIIIKLISTNQTKMLTLVLPIRSLKVIIEVLIQIIIFVKKTAMIPIRSIANIHLIASAQIELMINLITMTMFSIKIPKNKKKT